MGKLGITLSAATTDVAQALEKMPQVQVRAFSLGLIKHLYGTLGDVAHRLRGETKGIPLYSFVEVVSAAVLQKIDDSDALRQSPGDVENDELLLSIQNEPQQKPPPRHTAWVKEVELRTLQYQYDLTAAADRWYVCLPPCSNLENIDVYSEPALLKVGLWQLFRHVDKRQCGTIFWVEALMSLLDASLKLRQNQQPSDEGSSQYSVVSNRTNGAFARAWKVVHVPELQGYLVLVAGNGRISRNSVPGQGKDHQIRLVSSTTLQVKREYRLLENAGSVLSLCYVNTGNGFIAIGYSDGRIRLVEAGTGQVKLTYPAYRCMLPGILQQASALNATTSHQGLNISGLSASLASGLCTSASTLDDSSNTPPAGHVCGQCCPYLVREDTHMSATALAWGSGRLFIGARQGQLTALDLGSGDRGADSKQASPSEGPVVVWSEKLHGAAVTSIAFLTGDCRLLATGSLDCTIVVIHMEHRYKYRRFRGHCSGVDTIVYNRLYGYLVSAGITECEPLCWSVNVLHSKPLPLRDGRSPHVHHVTNLVAVDHSSHVLSMDKSGMVKVWDLVSLTCSQTVSWSVTCSPNDVLTWRAAAYNQTGRQMFATSSRRVVVLGYGTTQQNTDPHAATYSQITAALYLPVARHFVTATRRVLKVWCAQHGKAELSVQLRDDVTSLCSDTANTLLYVGSASGVVHCFDASLVVTEPLRSFHHPSGFPVTSLLMLPSDEPRVNCMVAVTSDGSLQIMRDTLCYSQGQPPAMTGTALPRARGSVRTDDVTSVAVHRKDRLLLAGSGSNQIIVYSTAHRFAASAVCHNKPAQARVTALVVLEPHLMFVSADSAGGIHIWRLLGKPRGSPDPSCHASFTPRLLIRCVTSHREGVPYTPVVTHLGWVGLGHSIVAAADDTGAVTCYRLSLTHRSLLLGDVLAMWEGCQTQGSVKSDKPATTFLTDGSLHPSLLVDEALSAYSDASQADIFLPNELHTDLSVVGTFHSPAAESPSAMCMLGTDSPSDATSICIFVTSGCSASLCSLRGHHLANFAKERETIGPWGVDLYGGDRHQYTREDCLNTTFDEMGDTGEKLLLRLASKADASAPDAANRHPAASGRRARGKSLRMRGTSLIRSENAKAKAAANLERTASAASSCTDPDARTAPPGDLPAEESSPTPPPAPLPASRPASGGARASAVADDTPEGQSIRTPQGVSLLPAVPHPTAAPEAEAEAEQVEAFSVSQPNGMAEDECLKQFRCSLRADLGKLQHRLSRVSKTVAPAPATGSLGASEADTLLGTGYRFLKPVFSQVEGPPPAQAPEGEVTGHGGVGITLKNDFILDSNVRPYNYKALLKEYKYKEVSYRKSMSVSYSERKKSSPLRLLFKVAHGDFDSDSDGVGSPRGDTRTPRIPEAGLASPSHSPKAQRQASTARQSACLGVAVEDAAACLPELNGGPKPFSLNAADDQEGFVFPNLGKALQQQHHHQMEQQEAEAGIPPREISPAPSHGGSAAGDAVSPAAVVELQGGVGVAVSSFLGAGVFGVRSRRVTAPGDVLEVGDGFSCVATRSRNLDVGGLRKERGVRVKEEKRQTAMLRHDKVKAIESCVEQHAGSITLQDIAMHSDRSSFVVHLGQGSDSRVGSALRSTPGTGAAALPDVAGGCALSCADGGGGIYRTSSEVMRQERKEFSNFLKMSAGSSRLPSIDSSGGLSVSRKGGGAVASRRRRRRLAAGREGAAEAATQRVAGSSHAGSLRSAKLKGPYARSAADPLPDDSVLMTVRNPPLVSRGEKAAS